MEIVKRTDEYEIVKKRSGRYGVRGKDRKWVNGDEKVKILLAEKLIKAPEPKAPEAEAAPDDAPAEEAAEASAEDAPAEEAAEAPAEDAPADEAPAEEASEESKD